MSVPALHCLYEYGAVGDRQGLPLCWDPERENSWAELGPGWRAPGRAGRVEQMVEAEGGICVTPELGPGAPCPHTFTGSGLCFWCSAEERAGGSWERGCVWFNPVTCALKVSVQLCPASPLPPSDHLPCPAVGQSGVTRAGAHHPPALVSPRSSLAPSELQHHSGADTEMYNVWGGQEAEQGLVIRLALQRLRAIQTLNTGIDRNFEGWKSSPAFPV